jgi:hypothetical protein
MSLQFFPPELKSFNGWPGQIRLLKSLDGLATSSSSAPAWKLGAICSSKDSGSGSILLSRFSFFVLLGSVPGSWMSKTKTSWQSGWWGRRRAERAGPHVQKTEDRSLSCWPSTHIHVLQLMLFVSSLVFSFPVPVPVDD